jgi:YHS domain-containing protein
MQVRFIFRGPHRLFFHLALAISVMTMPAPAWSGAVNVDGVGLAIQGYDPVAYFNQNQAIAGSAEFTASHAGATYRFVSARNLDAFLQDPAKYVPAYGGYCAFGMAQGYKAPVEPDKFTIVNGRLYLNYNGVVQSTWRKEIDGNIQRADTNWKEIGDQ